MRRSSQSQQDLRQQEERWNATYEHAAIGIVEIDADGRFLRVNESICDITGLTREELLGWKLFARTHPDDRDVDEDLYRRQVKGEIGFYSIEKRFVRKDGRVIWCSIRSSTVRDADGHFLYGVRVVQDITARKEAEDRQKLLMDELNHRVKNTLATVQSLATQTARGTNSPEAFRQVVRRPADRAQPGARSAHTPALDQRGPARHRLRRRLRPISRKGRNGSRSRAMTSRSRRASRSRWRWCCTS